MLADETGPLVQVALIENEEDSFAGLVLPNEATVDSQCIRFVVVLGDVRPSEVRGNVYEGCQRR